jgi:hypothetical protein
MSTEPKFKYLISPDNTYMLVYDDLGYTLQITGKDILAYMREKAKLDQLKEIEEEEL